MGPECTERPARARGRPSTPSPRLRSPAMALDPRTPVLVGVGQVTNRPDRTAELSDRPAPLELMIGALRAAAEDCTGAPPGASGTPGARLLQRADSVRVVRSLSWYPTNPALTVADRLGITAGETVLTATGGNMPQALLHDAVGAIARGDLDVVAVTGAECGYTRAGVRRHPDQPRLPWIAVAPDDAPAPHQFGTDRAPATEVEVAHGMVLPIHAYPLIENALRLSEGWTRTAHLARIGSLWSRFSSVAATNPHAWITSASTAHDLVTPSAANRMVAYPYPKLLTANIQVDQGAAYLCCSVEAAQAAGIPRERWVFPLAGAEANDHWFLSERHELGASPAIRLAGRTALGLADVGIDDVAFIDLYSCFPCIVQIAAAELGLDLDGPIERLTLTGGLTFSGGPGNNYTSHGIASLVPKLREHPDVVGMTTGNGWFATKHAIGLYAGRPPGGSGFRSENVQPAVDALASRAWVTKAEGDVSLETFTVTYDRDGAAERAIVVARTADGERVWANSDDPDVIGPLTGAEVLPTAGRITADRFEFR
jgi:acetyl-CoA C-acetyltransferase